jgi:nucleotide-binding universal stress UspA family protein
MSTPRPIIAGVDGSHSSLAAAHYAAALARRHAAPLHLVYAYSLPYYDHGLSAGLDSYAFIDDQPEAAGEAILAEIAEQLGKEFPDLVDVRTKTICANPAFALIEQSRTAGVTVVGSRGIGGFAEMLLGSVSAQVAAHGYGPVVVVRPPIADRIIEPGPEQRPGPPSLLGPVLVGFDGSPAAGAALRFAAAEAAQRGVPLIVAHVYWSQVWSGERDLGADPSLLAEKKAWQLLQDAVVPVRARYPDLDVELRPIHSMNPGYSLVEASRDVALVVTGSRGHGGFTGLLLGSVSRNLVHHGHCCVAVVHTAA